MYERFLNLEYDKRTIRVRYLESDNYRQEHLVLFIHGLGSSAERWLDIPDALSLYFHTFAIDLPGFGGSDKPSDIEYTVDTFSDIVKQFIGKVAVAKDRSDNYMNKKVTLIGHSLGGYIALKIAAADQNAHLHKLILIDSSGNLERPTPLLDQYLDAAMHPSKEKVRNVFEQLVANPMWIPDAVVQGFINRISNPQSQYAFESTLKHSANTQIGIENLNKIGRKGIPTLILWGTEDKLIPLGHSEIFKDAIKGATVITIPRTGHAPFTEKPALVCEYMHRFLVEK
ncbi:MAG: alpha/beta hydrolase [Thermoproteota archaeon]|nr:alpha/beta hydrolase [Thermoproteota archaeon]